MVNIGSDAEIEVPADQIVLRASHAYGDTAANNRQPDAKAIDHEPSGPRNN